MALDRGTGQVGDVDVLLEPESAALALELDRIFLSPLWRRRGLLRTLGLIDRRHAAVPRQRPRSLTAHGVKLKALLHRESTGEDVEQVGPAGALHALLPCLVAQKLLDVGSDFVRALLPA